MANTARVTKIVLEYGGGATRVELDPGAVEVIIIGNAGFERFKPCSPARQLRIVKLGALLEVGGTGVRSLTRTTTDPVSAASLAGEEAWWLSDCDWIHPEEDSPA